MTGEESAGTSDFSWKCVFNIEGKYLRTELNVDNGTYAIVY